MSLTLLSRLGRSFRPRQLTVEQGWGRSKGRLGQGQIRGQIKLLTGFEATTGLLYSHHPSVSFLIWDIDFAHRFFVFLMTFSRLTCDLGNDIWDDQMRHARRGCPVPASRPKVMARGARPARSWSPDFYSDSSSKASPQGVRATPRDPGTPSLLPPLRLFSFFSFPQQ